MKNQFNYITDNKISKQQIRNPQFFNPFQNTPLNYKKQYQHFTQNSSNKHQKSSSQLSENKKSNKIKQAKQLLAQKLKEVTNSHHQQSINNQRITQININNQKNKNQVKAWDCHLNPISKLTKQPFARSKTCEQMRKQYSLKKQRKRNNSASKYNTPSVTHCQREVRSTGLNSKDIHTGQQVWVQKQQKNQKQHRSPKIQTEQFTLSDPFGNNMIQTFDQQQIKKLSQDAQKKKYKSKYSSNKKAQLQQKLQQKDQNEISNDMKYPFKINTIINRIDHQQIRSPYTNQDSGNKSSSSNLLLNESNTSENKFTPKLQRYMFEEKQQVNNQQYRQQNNFQKNNNLKNISPRDKNNNERKIRKSQQQQKPINQNEDEQNEQNSQDSFAYSQEQGQRQQAYYTAGQLNELRSTVRSQHYANQLVTNLHFTNTILQQKLKIKQLEIEQLNRNYFQLKKQFLHVKNIQNQQLKNQNYQNQNIRYPIHGQNYQATSHLSNQKYLTNNQIEHSHIQNSQSVTVDLNRQISQLPSPKFCDGIEQQFSRQRQAETQPKLYEPLGHQQKYIRNQQHITIIPNKFNNKKQLFSSDMSQKISQQFDSEEIYMANYQLPPHKYSSRQYVFKKSNFNQNVSRPYENIQKKRDSFVYTLGQQSEHGSSKKQIHISQLSNQNSNSKHRSSYVGSQQMLLQPVTRSVNSEDKINLLSPIKCNDGQKQQNGSSSSKYLSYRTSMTKSQNKISDESMRKFDYYLTPQKDQSNLNNLQIKEQNEGLFEIAFSTMRKRKSLMNQSNQRSDSHQYSNSSSKKQQMIDPIIENNIE